MSERSMLQRFDLSDAEWEEIAPFSLVLSQNWEGHTKICETV